MQPIWKSQPRISEPNLEDYPVLKEYEDVFGELSRISTKERH
jgi:hypothetical protein